jgi:hypothetical protein
VSGNSADGLGGGISNVIGGVVTLTDSTVSGNSAEGVYGGGGIFNVATLTLTNSTVSGNSATNGWGGGIQNITFDSFNSGNAKLINSTVSGNSATNGGGGIDNDWTLTLTNTLVDDDCAQEATDVSGGGNIESPGNTCGFDTNKGDQFDVTAEQLNLGPLQDNGGPTMTHALGAGSVAIDAIPEEVCVDADGEPLTTDQRGEPRPAGSGCDVGAFEVQP